MFVFSTNSLKANNCSTADTLSSTGALATGIINNGEHWFKITAQDSIARFFGYWESANSSPTKIYVYSGTCSNLNLNYSESFVFTSDTTNQFVTHLQAGSYFIKIVGDNNDKIWLSAQPEDFTLGCPTLGCNFVGNHSFEDFTNTGSIIPFGQIQTAACWDNPSTHPGATPDYMRDPRPFVCAPNTAVGNMCKPFGYETWPNNSNQHGTARIINYSSNNPDRREYITSILQDNQGISNPLQPFRTYYISVRVRNDYRLRFFNDALGVVFTGNPYFVPHQNVLPINNNPYTNFTNTGTYNNTNWRQEHAFVTNDNTQKDFITIGNFDNNNVTNSRVVDNDPTITNPNLQLAGVFIDNVEVYEMPDAGANYNGCEDDQITLGYQPSCLQNNITYQWYDGLWNLISTAATPTITVKNGTELYSLIVTYNGTSFTSFVTVTGKPMALTASIIENNLCNGNNLEYKITNYDPALYTYAATLTGGTGTVNIYPNGTVAISNVSFNGILGIGTVNITATNSNCSKTISFDYYDCCQDSPTGIPVFNQPFSISNQGTSGETYNIYGTVTLDDNYYFDNCQFFLQPDAQLVVDPNYQITFDNCTFESCNNYKWDRIFNNHATSNLEMINCTISEALRGVHSEDDAFVDINNCTFSDNTLSQYVNNYTNAAGVFSCNSNTYNMYPVNSLTQQHAQSSVNLAPLLSLLDAKVVGIKVKDAFEVTVNNGNTFWSDYTTNWNEYLHVWYENSSGFIDNNTFYEGRNIYLQNSDVSVVNVNEFKSTQQPFGEPTGVEAFNSLCFIDDNTFKDGARIIVREPINTVATNNVMSGNSTLPLIDIKNTALNGAFTKIQENTITAAFGIVVKNIETVWPQSGGTIDKVLINNNYIYLTHPNNQGNITTNETGIFADHCPGVSIGQNQITCLDVQNGASLDDATSAMVVGIKLDESPNGFVGCNFPIDYCGRGLELNGDASRNFWQSSNQYQSNHFGSNYNGIYLANGAIVDNFGSSSLGADNKWIDIPGIGYAVGVRINDQGFVPPTNGNLSIDYFFSGSWGIGNDNYPQNNSSIISVQSPASVTPNNCNSAPPNNKRISSTNVRSLKIYPNPANDILSIEVISENKNAMQLNICNNVGDVIWQSQSSNKLLTIPVNNWANGFYVLKVIIDNTVLVERFVIVQ